MLTALHCKVYPNTIHYHSTTTPPPPPTANKAIHKFDKLNPDISGVFHPNCTEVISNTDVVSITSPLSTMTTLNGRVSCLQMTQYVIIIGLHMILFEFYLFNFTNIQLITIYFIFNI